MFTVSLMSITRLILDARYVSVLSDLKIVICSQFSIPLIHSYLKWFDASLEYILGPKISLSCSYCF